MFARVGLLRLIGSEVLRDLNNGSHSCVLQREDDWSNCLPERTKFCYPRNHKVNTRGVLSD